MKTYSAKPSEVTRKWYVLDASQEPLGRVSSKAAQLLTGKNKPMYTPHIDCGDYVVITNADKLVVTGDKLLKKAYYRHSGFPGGLKESNLSKEMEKDSTHVIVKSIQGMLPVNKLRAGRLERLKVYKGEEHNHQAQNPEVLSLKENK